MHVEELNRRQTERARNRARPERHRPLRGGGRRPWGLCVWGRTLESRPVRHRGTLVSTRSRVLPGFPFLESVFLGECRMVALIRKGDDTHTTTSERNFSLKISGGYTERESGGQARQHKGLGNTKRPGKTCSCRLRTRVKHPAAALKCASLPCVTCASAS